MFLNSYTRICVFNTFYRLSGSRNFPVISIQDAYVGSETKKCNTETISKQIAEAYFFSKTNTCNTYISLVMLLTHKLCYFHTRKRIEYHFDTKYLNSVIVKIRHVKNLAEKFCETGCSTSVKCFSLCECSLMPTCLERLEIRRREELLKFFQSSRFFILKSTDTLI